MSRKNLLIFEVFIFILFVGFIFFAPPLFDFSSENLTETIPGTSSSTSPIFKTGMATMFWVGEPSDESNDFIPNHISYWDEQWLEHFGGVDDPQKRCSLKTCGFTPKENPFYVALPYAEFNNETGTIKDLARKVPWFVPGERGSFLKNRWVHVVYEGVSCYGQWEDVGPNGEDDFAYVFGSASKPTNTFGVSAGIDLSPAMFECLNMEDNANVSWRFVSGDEIPPGPWKDVVTTSGMTWVPAE